MGGVLERDDITGEKGEDTNSSIFIFILKENKASVGQLRLVLGFFFQLVHTHT